MGIIGFLKFALICIHFLAWPVIALGYPLLASIRAIETGSIYHMRKLVIYWTLFSLISLFEFAFVKVIEWIPFWSSIRLIAIFWLVMPRFNGAHHAYRNLVRPVLSVNLQAFIDKFYDPITEKPRKKETFLDVAEQNIKENGPEALEKLIASKHECKECKNSQRDTQVLEAEEKSAAVTSKQLNEPDAAQRNNETSEATMKSAATEANRVQHAQSDAADGVPKGTDAAATVKETTPPEQSAENRRPETPPVKKVQQEWTCNLCKVTTTCEKNLNDHLQGSKHKSKCESLKASKLQAEDTRPSPSAKGKSNQSNVEAAKKKVGQGSQRKSSEKTQERAQFQGPKAKQGGGAKLYCKVCDVKVLSDIDLASHLKGKRHLSNLEGPKVSFPEHAIDPEITFGNELVNGGWGPEISFGNELVDAGSGWE